MLTFWHFVLIDACYMFLNFHYLCFYPMHLIHGLVIFGEILISKSYVFDLQDLGFLWMTKATWWRSLKLVIFNSFWAPFQLILLFLSLSPPLCICKRAHTHTPPLIPVYGLSHFRHTSIIYLCFMNLGILFLCIALTFELWSIIISDSENS